MNDEVKLVRLAGSPLPSGEVSEFSAHIALKLVLYPPLRSSKRVRAAAICC